jgi:hypothetical protein
MKISLSEKWWWGYLHNDGSIQVKRWFGDEGDYTTYCEGNDFVVKIIYPFKSASREEALDKISKDLS